MREVTHVPEIENPFGVRPGQVWQDRYGFRLVVDALEKREVKPGGRKGNYVAACVREHTGIRVHPALTSFAGSKRHGYTKVSD